MSVQSMEMPHANAFRTGLVAILGVVLALVAFSGALVQLADRWASQEEYSHGFLIPLISVWLLWTRRNALRANIGRPAWSGPILVLLAAAMHITGQISAIPFLSQLGFIVALVGLVLGLGGYRMLKVTAFPILFLLFAIPMPRFIDYTLSLQLQLISSKLGALFIRLFGIPVFLDGNVLDLGYYKIQIVEACSGLRYIYPLLSLSFLAAYLFNAPFWQRTVVFLSAIPITIVMNSFRIGVIGVTVNYWGTEAAEGFLHLFEGWFIFLACANILMLEIYVLARISGKSFFEVFGFQKVTANLVQGEVTKSARQTPIVASLLILGFAGLAAFQVSNRAEIIPDRPRFVAFPERIGPWQGHAFLLEPETERLIRPDDYLLSDYRGPDGEIVNLYVAYYASQRKNDTPHSPSECIPANGWNIKKIERTSYNDDQPEWPLNRVVIEKNSVRQLVYYWFDERGRKIANEYLAKWYFHADAIVMNRTDGALVRLVTQIHGRETEADADRRLQAFIRATMPTLSEYLPPRVPSQIKSFRVGAKSAKPY